MSRPTGTRRSSGRFCTRLATPATGYAPVGDPADEILATGKAFDAELVVIGARSLGTVGRLVLGSVSTKVMHESDCDGLVVK
jgi:nucleotide-binding universal stress UspA family protein